MVILCVMSVLVLIIVRISVLTNRETPPVIPMPSMTYTPSVVTPSVVSSPITHAPPPAGPAPVLDKVLDDYPIVEVIDLPNQPVLGPAWDVVDGNLVDEDLRGDFFVTPCGVFVTVLTAISSSETAGATSRIMGYDIASGAQLWSHMFSDVTGQTNPVPNTDVEPSYTTDCQMVISMFDLGYKTSHRQKVTLVVDLATGASQSVHSESLDGCVAAGEGWVGCWTTYPSSQIMAVNLGDPQAGWTQSADTSYLTLPGTGDGVIAGKIWTSAGYRDPVTHEVVFGADSTMGSQFRGPDPWIVYMEPFRPGGYRSGLAVRMEGPLNADVADEETCSIMAWDPVSDAAMWPSPQSLPCGEGYHYSWTAAGQALIVTFNIPGQDNVLTRAYSLSAGDLLWEEKGYPDDTLWSDAHGGEPAKGVSQQYVLFSGTWEDGYTQHLLRIADGAEFLCPQFGVRAFGTTMAYDAVRMTSHDPYSLIGYVIDPNIPGVYPPEAWTLPIDLESQNVWTFVIDEQMYVVYGPLDGRNKGMMKVSPLVT